MRLINFTVEIEDDDMVEFALRKWMDAHVSPKYVKTLKNADHIKDDPHYKKLRKAKKDANNNLDNYIDKTKL
tara:strand:+ start:2735 stop:2950 length:216 start_codon:yes stop_codon:yes gene_type:complete